MSARPWPTELRVRQASRLLEVDFDDGVTFSLPAEYLRVMTPSAVCERWRRMISLRGMEPSSRRCGFHPVSRPKTICITEPVWITIMMGA